ncbi:UNVERIFIED_CONTAM: hypothetical protein FKN15_034413 [Acipenser sinensis]
MTLVCLIRGLSSPSVRVRWFISGYLVAEGTPSSGIKVKDGGEGQGDGESYAATSPPDNPDGDVEKRGRVRMRSAVGLEHFYPQRECFIRWDSRDGAVPGSVRRVLRGLPPRSLRGSLRLGAVDPPPLQTRSQVQRRALPSPAPRTTQNSPGLLEYHIAEYHITEYHIAEYHITE